MCQSSCLDAPKQSQHSANFVVHWATHLVLKPVWNPRLVSPSFQISAGISSWEFLQHNGKHGALIQSPTIVFFIFFLKVISYQYTSKKH